MRGAKGQCTYSHEQNNMQESRFENMILINNNWNWWNSRGNKLSMNYTLNHWRYHANPNKVVSTHMNTQTMKFMWKQIRYELYTKTMMISRKPQQSGVSTHMNTLNKYLSIYTHTIFPTCKRHSAFDSDILISNICVAFSLLYF